MATLLYLILRLSGVFDYFFDWGNLLLLFAIDTLSVTNLIAHGFFKKKRPT